MTDSGWTRKVATFVVLTNVAISYIFTSAPRSIERELSRFDVFDGAGMREAVSEVMHRQHLYAIAIMGAVSLSILLTCWMIMILALPANSRLPLEACLPLNGRWLRFMLAMLCAALGLVSAVVACGLAYEAVLRRVVPGFIG